MKATPRFMIRATLALTAAGVVGFFGACKDSTPPPVQPPPPSAPAAPSGLTATAVGATTINLAWTDNSTNETGFRVDRCTGAGCTNFAQVGSNLAANTVAFSDVGLTASTAYSYRVRAFGAAAADTSAFTPKAEATTGVVSTAFTMVGAGEISTCNSDAGPRATAALLKGVLDADPEAIAFTVGNNLADTAAGSTFQGCFAGKGWDDAAYKARTWYAIGNGDFGKDRGPDAVYGFFGDRTGPAHKGWFSFDKGSWHIVVLNTSDWEHGAATYGIDAQLNTVPSEQRDWLANDLQANTKPCVAVISWERRIYRSGNNTVSRNSNMIPMTTIMYANGVDFMISAKDKTYETFTPVNPVNGAIDQAGGLRQFIVGSGGRTNDAPIKNSDGTLAAMPAGQEADIRGWGVLKLTLGDGNYSYEFLNTVPGGPTNKSVAPVPCH